MKIKYLVFLLLLSFTAVGQSRIFRGSGVPSAKLTNFNNRDLYRDTIGQVTYIWNGARYVVAADQFEGPQGPAGPQGPQGAAGSGSGASFGPSVRWVSNFAELKSAVAAIGNPVTAIYIDSTIYQTERLQWPVYFSSLCFIYGNGNLWKLAPGVDTANVKTYPTMSEAKKGIDGQFHFEGIRFEGAINQTLFNWQATYGSSWEKCWFKNFDNALLFQWAMGVELKQCYVWDCNVFAWFDFAKYPDLSEPNSQACSNHPLLFHNKIRTKPGNKAVYRFRAASGVLNVHDIWEGADAGGAEYLTDFDYAGSTTTKDFNSLFNHIEITPGIAAYRIRANDGYHAIRSIYAQKAGVLIDADGANGYPRILADQFCFLNPSAQFKSTGGVRWNFTNFPETFTISSLTRWVGGAVPFGTSFDSYQSSGMTKYLQGYTVR